MSSSVPQAAKFLLETGLLAEFNRLVLHPRGLALPIIQKDDGSCEFCDELIDNRRDPDGMEMGPELLAEIREKLKQAPPYTPNRLALFPPDGIEPLERKD
jgi:hypothetical protein